MKIPIPNADPGPPPAGKIRNPNPLDSGPENLWRTIEITMKFMAYNWNHYENPHPKRRPRTAAGRENPQSKFARVGAELLLLFSSPHEKACSACSAGNNLISKKVHIPSR